MRPGSRPFKAARPVGRRQAEAPASRDVEMDGFAEHPSGGLLGHDHAAGVCARGQLKPCLIKTVGRGRSDGHAVAEICGDAGDALNDSDDFDATGDGIERHLQPGAVVRGIDFDPGVFARETRSDARSGEFRARFSFKGSQWRRGILEFEGDQISRPWGDAARAKQIEGFQSDIGFLCRVHGGLNLDLHARRVFPARVVHEKLLFGNCSQDDGGLTEVGESQRRIGSAFARGQAQDGGREQHFVVGKVLKYPCAAIDNTQDRDLAG